MLSCVSCGHIESAERRILRHATTIVGITMMVLQVGTLFGIKYFPGPCVFLLYFNQGTNFPECLGNWFE